jgi:hypothetical protein
MEPAMDRTQTNSGGAASLSSIASDSFAKASEAASSAGQKVKSAAADTASAVTSTITEQVRDVIDRQVGSNAQAAVQFAGSMKSAAEEMGDQSPLMAALARGMAEKVEGIAGDLQNQTVDQMMRTAADFTRRQPALVFGLAALTGFLMFRTWKSAPEQTQSTASPPIQPATAEDPFATDAG